MRKLTKQEIKAILTIFLILFSVTFYNLQIAIRKSRDAQRRTDLRTISDALGKFFSDYGFFPPSVDGKIVFCKSDNYEQIMNEITESGVFDRYKFFTGLRPCEWGQDSFADLFDENSVPYLQTLPADSKHKDGLKYVYISNTKLFQIYSYLEGEDSEDTYNPLVVNRNLMCGTKVCSYGRSYSDIPLNISIEEYEAILLEKSQ